MKKNFKLVIDPFCHRQFDKENKSSSYIDYPREEFEAKINELYDPAHLKDG